MKMAKMENVSFYGSENKKCGERKKNKNKMHGGGNEPKSVSIPSSRSTTRPLLDAGK